MRAFEKMSVEKEILVHENAGFFKALVGEKKRRRRGRNMGLFPKNEPGQAMFFSPDKVNAAQSQQQLLNAQKEQEKLEKKLKAEARVEEKERKAREVQERREQRAEKAAEKAAQKQLEKEAKELQKQANQQLRLEEQTQKHRRSNSTSAQQRKEQNAPIVEVEDVQMRSSRNGRSVTLPARYRA